MRLRARRRILGMTQEKLGELLGLTFQQVQKYERGANRIGSSRLFELSQILQTPVSYFFEGMSGRLPQRSASPSRRRGSSTTAWRRRRRRICCGTIIGSPIRRRAASCWS
ncbi:helix-turn-helix domain-containing protein [Hankyongella ginsenosidimutans]|uniref:helix-turn-helix domain-containing protein n=1 Tax=Hankyongella ginsenosidimutans TaxID=1763828 RepID=UPI003CCC754D